MWITLEKQVIAEGSRQDKMWKKSKENMEIKLLRVFHNNKDEC